MTRLSLDTVAESFKRCTIKLKHLWPEKLPIDQVGITRMIDEVIFAEDVPNDPLYHHAIASALMHLGPATDRKARRFFSRSLRKQIANQVAFEKIQAIKEEELKKQNKEVTASEKVSLDQGVQETSSPVV